MVSGQWITPFKKQCFVVAGASINISQLGMVMGFAAVLLPQLQAAGSPIPIDDSSGSWIAAIPGFALLVGNLLIPPLMAKSGRRKANLISIVIVLVGWVCVTIANSVAWLLVGRLLQGLSMGMSSCLVPILIGEYTSPKNRGPFSMAMSLVMGAGTFTAHVVGSYASWQTTALVCTCITFFDLLIVVYSPESPSWLADQGRYDDSRKVFLWLRGKDDMDELNKMLTASKLVREAKDNVPMSLMKRMKGYLTYIKATVRKKEFYKPIFIMIHLFTLSQWGGVNVLAPYAVDIIQNVVGKETNTALVIVAMDSLRMISCIFAVYIIKKIKRRTMLFSFIGMNTAILFITALYVYAKSYDLLPYDHPIIGITLILFHMFTIATGSLPLPFTIAGEIFPLEYRSLSSGISSFFASINIFLAVKTLPYLFKNFGVHGAYCLYGGISIYCLTIAWLFLPETKDRTLQNIEDEFRGKVDNPEELKASQPLTWISDEKKQTSAD